jgi:hypothetical protein
MAFNQHIGIFSSEEELQQAIQNNLLETPWVANVNGKMYYDTDITIQEKNPIDVWDEIQSTFPVLCTEEEYDILVENGEGNVTNPISGEKTFVTFNPELYYYTYEPNENE